MNIRIKFRKYGPMKFISHLDVMRYFQKVIRRAEIDICFSEGFSPHMIMSFASPLGVGLTSDAEYVDIRVHTAPSSAEAVRRMNETMAEGMEVVSFRLLPENSKNAMSIVAAADYEVRFREGQEPERGWQERWKEFLSQPEIRIVKETKKGKQEVDIRPWVYDWSMIDQRIFPSCDLCEPASGVDGSVVDQGTPSRKSLCGPASGADGSAVDQGFFSPTSLGEPAAGSAAAQGLYLQVSAGSVHNLKPELLMQAFGSWAGMDIPAAALLIHRKEIYADQGTEGSRKLIPLEGLGDDIG